MQATPGVRYYCQEEQVAIFMQSYCYRECIACGRYSLPRASLIYFFNPFTPNDHYSGRTAQLTSKRCILYIYLTNIGTECFKHGIYSPFFFLFKMQFVSLF